MLEHLATVLQRPDDQVVNSATCNHLVIWTKCYAADTALLSVVRVHFLPELLGVHVPNCYVPVVAPRRQQDVGVLEVLAPLNRVDGTPELVKNVHRRTLFGLP